MKTQNAAGAAPSSGCSSSWSRRSRLQEQRGGSFFSQLFGDFTCTGEKTKFGSEKNFFMHTRYTFLTLVGIGDAGWHLLEEVGEAGEDWTCASVLGIILIPGQGKFEEWKLPPDVEFYSGMTWRSTKLCPCKNSPLITVSNEDPAGWWWALLLLKEARAAKANKLKL